MIDRIQEAHPELTFLKADGFDEAVIGVDHESHRLIYSIKKMVKILKKDMSSQEALEYLYFNTLQAYVGPKTPIWCDDL